MSNEEFANHLGVAPRTVAGWHQNPTVRPRPDTQRVLDTAYEKAGSGVRARFSSTRQSIHIDANAEAKQLTVAIAIVQREDRVLLVQRRDESELCWQFPAGIVKPRADSATTAVKETYVETNVHCSVTKKIGERVHPLTGVYCEYFHCDYLAGEAQNCDIAENASVIWAPIETLRKFIPETTIYTPIFEVLEGTYV